MNFVSLFLPALILVLVLHLLNNVFNYKSILINLFGSTKYKGTLIAMMLIIGYTLIIKYDINPFRSTLGISVFWSYLYLVSVPKNLH
jgi:hypothetical protein